MKKVLLPLLGILLIAGCEKEANTPLTTESDTALDFRSKEDKEKKIDVCHYDAEDGSWQVINISINAWPDHAGHGDAVDMDGDGYFTNDKCGEQDCDDATYDPDNSCGCIEGEVEIYFNGGPLFVAPADEPGITSEWQQAIDKCKQKGTDGCDWYLPSIEELNAIYENRNVIGGFADRRPRYWSSSEYSADQAWAMDLDIGFQYYQPKYSTSRCRCVRR